MKPGHACRGYALDGLFCSHERSSRRICSLSMKVDMLGFATLQENCRVIVVMPAVNKCRNHGPWSSSPEYLKTEHSIARAFRFTSIVPGSENDNKNGKDQWRNRLHSMVESILGALPKPDQGGGVRRSVTGALAGPASSPCTQGNKAMNPA
ncbi:hypothetical protein [Azotobacter salinestris]|uniref:hypothetical protein n=1 Tax=Azotobacter salinestris TaxID=69964 RepID=UPI0032E00740